MKRTIYNPALKETIVFVTTSEETSGAYSQLEISLEPGGGNPMHYHKTYTELFTAQEGVLGMELKNGKKIFLNPGESYLVKRGENYRFFNQNDHPITFTNKVVLGSTGLENTLRILCGLAQDGQYSKANIASNIYHMRIGAVMSDMRLMGLAGLITTPLVRAGRRKGIEAALINKYCV